MDTVHVGGLGGTYGGNPIAAAAALAVLDKIEREDLLDRRAGSARRSWRGSVRCRNATTRSATCAVAARCVRSSSSPTAATKEPLDAAPDGRDHVGGLAQGVLVLTAGTYGNVVRLLPPINIDEALFADGLDVLESAVASAVA